MEYERDDRRLVEESARRGDYLVAGHTPETQIALLTRDVEHLIGRVREAEDRLRELESAKPAPDLIELLESHRRQQWLLKSLGMIAVAAPAALFAGMQIWAKFIEWVRGH